MEGENRSFSLFFLNKMSREGACMMIFRRNMVKYCEEIFGKSLNQS